MTSINNINQSTLNRTQSIQDQKDKQEATSPDSTKAKANNTRDALIASMNAPREASLLGTSPQEGLARVAGLVNGLGDNTDSTKRVSKLAQMARGNEMSLAA